MINFPIAHAELVAAIECVQARVSFLRARRDQLEWQERKHGSVPLRSDRIGEIATEQDILEPLLEKMHEKEAEVRAATTR